MRPSLPHGRLAHQQRLSGAICGAFRHDESHETRSAAAHSAQAPAAGQGTCAPPAANSAEPTELPRQTQFPRADAQRARGCLPSAAGAGQAGTTPAPGPQPALPCVLRAGARERAAADGGVWGHVPSILQLHGATPACARGVGTKQQQRCYL